MSRGTLTIGLLTLQIVFFSTSQNTCFLEEDVPEKMKVIRASLEKLTVAKEANITPKFGNSARDICPSLHPKNIYLKFKPADSKFLGSGSYGKVFTSEFLNPETKVSSRKAIKLIEVKPYLVKKLKKEIKNDEELIEGYVESIFNGLINTKNFRTNIRDFLNEGSNIQEKISDQSEQDFDNKLSFKKHLNLFDSNFSKENEVKYKYIKKYIFKLNNEISINRKVNGLSNQNSNLKSPRLSLFNSCIIDRNLNAYLVFGKLENTLDILINTCATTLHPEDTTKMMKMALDILYEVDFLHRADILHCDIKPSNIMFRDNTYKKLVLVDFGISTSDKCVGGTKSYFPPENFVKVEQKKEFLEELSYKSDKFKYDAFEVGMTLLILTIGNEKFQKISELYQEIQKFNSAEKVFKSEERLISLIKFHFTDSYSHWLPNIEIQPTVKSTFLTIILNLIKFKVSSRMSVRDSMFCLFDLYKMDSQKKTRIPKDFWNCSVNNNMGIELLAFESKYTELVKVINNESVGVDENQLI
jgi:serine/threonine protein kinase